ncbi:Transferase [Trema orientale]|uniref:Transferase n=1 Tax=Trema orientale TaxID=63057 RepID=A0A2P5CBE5_TREOI|nr:Transferase [Trema orientale]
MELTIIAKETVRPSCLPLDHPKPYKLCLFDQITPMTYVSVVLFYRSPDQNFNDNVPQTLSQLKKSLSETLNLFYPLSGRTNDNFYIDDFDAGVTYVEARVSCSLTEFSKLSQTELLNQFVPFPPLLDEREYSGESELPLIGLQVNIFACGGIALGTSSGHKIADGGTICHFLTSWAATFHGSRENLVSPNLSNASVVFPPRELLPPKYQTLTGKLWFNKGNLVTRRFVFDSNNIASIRDLAKSEGVSRPSRNDALTCFIWKHASAAAATVTGGAARASAVAQAVNLRPRMKSQALSASIGNLFWWSSASSSDACTAELSELVETLRESLLSLNEYLERTDQGEVGFAAVSECYDKLEGILNSSAGDVYVFTNWGRFFNEVDFGWGKPVWVGPHGKPGRFMNVTVFVEAQVGKGIEAFVTLEENHMAVLEKDPKFLAFASPNPHGLLPDGECD